MSQHPWTIRLTRSIAGLAGVLTLGAPALARAEATVAATHATLKVRPADSVSGQPSIHLSAGRNEFEAFQVVINGGNSGATGVSATASALAGAGSIGADHVTLYREALYQANNPSGPDGQTGPWPDALVPDTDSYAHEKRNAFPFDVPTGENRAIWVELLVPADAAPGDYAGKVTVTGSGIPGGSVDVPVQLTVHRFTLPSTPSLKTAFGMYWSGPCDGHFGGYAGCGGDSGVEHMRDLYIRAALDHRISIENSVYYGPKDNDWSHFDQVYGPLLDGTANTRLAGAKVTSMRYQATRDVTLAGQWAQHFRGKGWFDRLFDYTCDEPPLTCAWSDIPTRANLMKQADPDFRTLVTTTLSEAQNNGAASSIDIMVPVVNFMEPRTGGSTRSQYDGYVGSGHELWMYESCMSHGCGGAFGDSMGSANPDPSYAGWPTYAIDASAVRNRALEWLSFKDGVSAELYYETALHLATAWTDSYDFGGNGDGTLFYPGKPSVIGGSTDIPVESIRLKMIREGVEDYEYLKMLSDAGEAAFAQQTAATLFPSASGSSSVDPAALYAAREALAQHLDAHFGGPVGSSTTSASSASSTSGTTGAAGSTASTSAGSTASSSTAGSTGSASTGSTGSTGGTGASTGSTGSTDSLPISVPQPTATPAGGVTVPPAAASSAAKSAGCSTGLGGFSLSGLGLVGLALRRRRK